MIDPQSEMSVKNYNISILSGDGIGPEVMDEAIRVLDSVSGKHDYSYGNSHP